MFAASGIEVLIILVFVAASAIFNWLKKSKEDSDWTQAETPRGTTTPQRKTPPVQPAPTKNLDWEEELRRMLEGTGVPPVTPPLVREYKPQPPRPVAPAPPPPVIQQPTMHVPQVFTQEKSYKGHCEHCGGHIEFPASMSGDMLMCPHCHQQTVLEPIVESRLERVMHRTESNILHESAAAYERAARLQESVAAQLAEISRQPVRAVPVHHKQQSAEVKKVVALLQTPQTARQAIVAGIILGPPKALEI